MCRPSTHVGYGLRGMAVPFHPFFIKSVQALCGYYPVKENDPNKGFKTAFASFIDNYGTHYINRQEGAFGWQIHPDTQTLS